MKQILLTGSLHPALAALLWTACIVLVLAVYRGHRLARPWNVVLPALRATAFFVLLLALLRPVLAITENRTQRGRIAVLLDDSGSMSVRDRYLPEEGVVAAWDLEWYPRALRATVFEEQHGAWTTVVARVVALEASVAGLQRQAAGYDARAVREARDTAGTVGAVARDLATFQSAYSNRVARWAYLAAAPAATNAAPAAESPPADFGSVYRAWDAGVRVAQDGLERAATALGAPGGEGTNLHDRVRLAATGVADAATALDEQRNAFPALQLEADRTLAAAGIPDVDRALAQLAQTDRWALVRAVLEEEPVRLLERLGERGDVDVFGLIASAEEEPWRRREWTNPTPERSSTRLGSALRAVLERYAGAPVAGVVLVTDGNHNAGESLDGLRETLRERGIPLAIAGVGAPRPPHDVAIESVSVPRTAFKEDRIRARVVLHRTGFEGVPLTLRVRRDDRTLREQRVEPGEAARVTVDLSFEEDEEGQHQYAVEVDAQEGEALERNNRRGFQVDVLEDRIRVLLLDEFPRWESRYLRMMLARDRRVDARTVFVASRKGGALTTGDDGFPADREDLFAYQLVILGDVRPDHFSRAQLQDLHDFVVERGGALVVMAGARAMPHAYAGTPLATVLPSGWQVGSSLPPRAHGPDGSVAVPLHATDAGKHDSLIQIGETPELTARLWSGLPGMNWVRSDTFEAHAADTLVATQGDALPVVLKGFAGAGKVLFLGSDSFWRWRDRAGWRYHHRLWGEVVLWGALGRTSGSDRYAKLSSDRLRYAPGETVRIRLRLLDESGRPIPRAEGALLARDESGKLLQRPPIFAVPGAPGEYRVEIEGLPRGRIALAPDIFELRAAETRAQIQIEVGDVDAGEYVHLSLQDAALARRADLYRPLTRADELAAAIERVEKRDSVRHDVELWSHAAALLLAVGLFSAEWQLRKRCRLA